MASRAILGISPGADRTWRRLGLCPEPASNESLSSWIDRVALAAGVQRRDIWRWVGLTHRPTSQPGAYGVDLLPAERETLRLTTGASDGLLDSMLLRRYNGIAFDTTTLNRDRPSTSTAWARTAWATIFPSFACPMCLDENPGIWPVLWKLGWSFACVRHRVYLSADCHECGTRWRASPIDARQSTACCAPSAPASDVTGKGATRRRRNSDDICGADAAAAPAISAADDIVGLQAQVNDLLAAHGAEDRKAAGEVVRAIRALVPIVMYLGGAHLSSGLGRSAEDAWGHHIDARDAELPRRGPAALGRYRSYSLPPSSPIVTAVAVRTAFDLHRNKDVDAWSRFAVDRTGSPVNTRAQWTQLLKFARPPAEHLDAINAVRDRFKFTVSAALDGRATHARGPHAGVGCDQVPSLIGEDTLWHLLPDFLRDRDFIALRRFAAMALARTLEPETISNWAEAAKRLGLSTRFASYGDRIQSKLRKADEGRHVDIGLTDLAARLADTEHATNFGRRRRALAGLFDVDQTDWDEVCRASAIDPTDRLWANRRHLAAAWIWELATGGDWHMAPALHLYERDVHEREMEVQRYVLYFKAKQLRHIEGSLRNLLQATLRRSNLEPTSNSWLAG